MGVRWGEGEAHTLPAPAGPITITPNLLMFADVLHNVEGK